MDDWSLLAYGLPQVDEDTYDEWVNGLYEEALQTNAARSRRRSNVNVRISYTQPRITGRQSLLQRLPEDARNIRCEVEIPAEEVPVDDFDVVRVRFEGGNHREYCYRDGGVKIGEYAVVPPTSMVPNRPQVVRVVGYGRNDYRGPIFASAMPVPTAAEI